MKRIHIAGLASAALSALLVCGPAAADNNSRQAESGQFELGGNPSALSSSDGRAGSGTTIVRKEYRDCAPEDCSRYDRTRSDKYSHQTKVLGDDARGQWRGREETDTSATLTGKQGEGMPPEQSSVTQSDRDAIHRSRESGVSK